MRFTHRIALCLSTLILFAVQAQAAPTQCPAPVMAKQDEASCSPSSAEPVYQTLSHGQRLAYFPLCAQGANTEYQMVHFDAQCGTLPLKIETLAGKGQLHIYNDARIFCESLKPGKSDASLECLVADPPSGFDKDRYLFDGAIMRLQQSSHTDVETNTTHIIFKRKS